jgi:hypothetical protein
MSAAIVVPLSEIPALDSRPGAPINLYLNFVGDTTPTWSDRTPGTTPAYDTDGDANSFSENEITDIRDIFSRVSDKFSPFNLNVTTTRPGNLAHGRAMQVVIGGTGTWESSRREAAGVALVNSFLDTQFPNKAFVFPANVAYSTKDTAEAVAHEAGHGFGLNHQSEFDAAGNLVNEYFHGDAATAPIMGFSFDASRGLWWRGKSSSSFVVQDDIATIASHVGFAADDYPGNPTKGPPLVPTEDGFTAQGFIGNQKDVDYFSFSTTDGRVSFSLHSAGMLNPKMTVLDDRGRLLINSDAAIDEAFSLTLPAGAYRVGVLSHGNYNDIGQYTLNVSQPVPDPNLVIEHDPAGGNKNAVHVIGTADDDSIIFNKAGKNVEVLLNGVSHGVFQNIGRVIADGLDGNDTISIDPKLTLRSELHGDAGNDVLTGSSGRDILFGGDGSDVLNGNGGDDLLVASDLAAGFNGLIPTIVQRWNAPVGIAARLKTFQSQLAALFPPNSEAFPFDSAPDTLVGGKGADAFVRVADDAISDLATADRDLLISNDALGT